MRIASLSLFFRRFWTAVANRSEKCLGSFHRWLNCRISHERGKCSHVFSQFSKLPVLFPERNPKLGRQVSDDQSRYWGRQRLRGWWLFQIELLHQLNGLVEKQSPTSLLFHSCDASRIDLEDARDVGVRNAVRFELPEKTLAVDHTDAVNGNFIVVYR